MSGVTTGWKLPERDREALLKRFPPRYAALVADHVTLRFGADEAAPLPEDRCGEVVGRSDDGEGVEALVVCIAGKTDRGDGSHYHISWSLGPGRRAKESNDVIAARGWSKIQPPIAIALEPARWGN